MTFARLALGAALTLGACSHNTAPPAAPDPAAGLTSVAVEMAAVPREMAFDGTVEALNQSTVSAQTSGRVVELPFDVGDYVPKGAIIVRITPTEQRARSSGAQANVVEAQARLAEARLADERARNLFVKGLVAKAMVDNAAADLKAAQARLDAAQSAEAEAREGVGYTTIRAPYAGLVVSRQVQLGETVTPGRTLMTGVSLEHLRAAVDIPQQQIGPLRKHGKARIVLPDGQSVEAAQLRIPPAADPATHSFHVLVTLPDGEFELFPGTLVKVAFVSGEQPGLQIPASALVRRGELTATYVIDRAGVHLRYLRTGTPTADGQVPVLAGLDAGERVALDPAAATALARTAVAGAAP